MDSRRPHRSNTKNNTAKDHAQKSLDIILNYSKTARRSKEYVAHPQTILKDDLKRGFGCETCYAEKEDAQRMSHRPDDSVQSIKSNEVNEFIDKYICNNNGANQTSNTNIITLNRDEFVRLKAGGSFLSKLTTPVKQGAQDTRADGKQKQEVKSQQTDIINNEILNLKGIKSSPITQLTGSCCYEKIMKQKFMADNEQSPMLNRIIDSVFDQHDKQRDNKQPDRKIREPPARSCSPESKVSEEKHIKFATPLISSDIKKSEHSVGDTDDNGEEYIKPKPPRPIRRKLTIVDFDKIFNTELKKRRGKVFKGDLIHSAMKNNPCATNISLEPTGSVKAALIHSAVTGLPNDVLFTDDHELMNAIDKFIQAENACTFEEALRVAEIAAKLASPGFEEEAAASAARNYKFQCNKQENFNTIPLDKKKKPIEIVAYVGSTKNQRA